MSLDLNLDKIIIIDFGSQFTQLIARRIRELGVFSEIISHKKIHHISGAQVFLSEFFNTQGSKKTFLLFCKYTN